MHFQKSQIFNLYIDSKNNGLQTQYKKAADALVSSTNFVIWYYVTDTDLTHLICFVGVLPLNLMLTVTNPKETAHF
jgi:hypothetical protein